MRRPSASACCFLAGGHRSHDCYALNANKNYQILEARLMNDSVYYRVALKDGTLVWTLINNPTAVNVAICK